MNKHFEIVDLPMPCEFILKNRSRFDLRTGIPNNALEVYKSGFLFLGLKEGAEKLFEKEKSGDLINLIRKAKRVQDVKVLALAKPSDKKVQEEASIKIESFNKK